MTPRRALIACLVCALALAAVFVPLAWRSAGWYETVPAGQWVPAVQDFEMRVGKMAIHHQIPGKNPDSEPTYPIEGAVFVGVELSVRFTATERTNWGCYLILVDSHDNRWRNDFLHLDTDSSDLCRESAETDGHPESSAEIYYQVPATMTDDLVGLVPNLKLGQATPLMEFERP
jgi:hypothetical protein